MVTDSNVKARPGKTVSVYSLVGYAALVVAIVALGVWFGPRLWAVYQLEVGGRLLESALGSVDSLEWWYVGPREVKDAHALEAAVAHLRQAESTSRAWRLLGQAQMAREDFLASIEALERFTALRPDHVLGHLELAAAYALANQRLEAIEFSRLLEVMPGARVSAPDLDGQVTYEPGAWQSEYVYPTTFGLPPDYGDRPTLFLHAGSRITYTVALTQPAVLHFGMGLDPRALGWGGDGATFEVFVNGQRIFLEHVPVEVAREGWQEREVDLASYTGQTVQLTLATTPGPKGDVTGDWAGWGEPRIEGAQAEAYRQKVRGRPWLLEWQRAGITAEDFIHAGEGARKDERYDEALGWYGWAWWLKPNWGEPWYYVGLLYEDQQEWPKALDAYGRATELGRLQWGHQSSPYYRMGFIYYLRLEPRQMENALAAFDAALAVDNFSSAVEAADCHHLRGEILRQQKADPGEYLSEYRRAIALNPRHLWAHIMLGITLYQQYQDARSAETVLLEAVELSPQSQWPYYYLGDIYRKDGRTAEAEAMFRHALEIDPDFEAAKKGLEAL